MSKWADCLISKVVYDHNNLIFRAMRHNDTGTGITTGTVVDRYTIASDITNGKNYITVYSSSSAWKKGCKIKTFRIQGEPYIRIDNNKVKFDFLGDIIELQGYEDELESMLLETQALTETISEELSTPIQESPTKDTDVHTPKNELQLKPNFTPESKQDTAKSKLGSKFTTKSAPESPSSLPQNPTPESKIDSVTSKDITLKPNSTLETLRNLNENLTSKQDTLEPESKRGSLPKDFETKPTEIKPKGTLPKDFTPEPESTSTSTPEPAEIKPKGTLPKDFTPEPESTSTSTPEPAEIKPKGTLPKDFTPEPKAEPEPTPKQLEELDDLKSQLDELHDSLEDIKSLAKVTSKQNAEKSDTDTKTKLSSEKIIGYCVKCKEKRHIVGAQNIVLKNGRHAVQGTCPECSCKIFRIVKKQ